MNPRSSQAYGLSALLHAAVVALVLLLGFMASQSTPETPKVFELIAGHGDNYGGTVAPALGVPGGIKVTIPEPPLPAPAAPAPAPVAMPPPPAAAPPQTSPAPAPVAKTDVVPNFARVEQRAASRKAARLEAAYKKQLAAEKRRQETYAQFEKEQGAKAAATRSSAAVKAPKVDAEGIAEGVTGGSTANKIGGAGGKALTREEQDLLDSYFAMLFSRLKENLVPPPGVSDKLEAYVEFLIAADGSISRLRILRSSGNAEFDASVREAFAQTHMPPRPDGRSDTRKMTVRMRDDDGG